MARLEDLTKGTAIRGIVPEGIVTIVDVRWYGTAAVELTYKDAAGRPGNQLLYRDDEPRLELVTAGRPWSFDADGGLLRLVSEARRIRLAHLFDPYLAVHTSLVEPLPHQITAVYEQMLPRQPLRYLLADDPGAGKTIMAGLYIKELLIRGDLQRCLVVCPGNLAEQWQDELYRRFGLPFDILTNDRIEAARTGNVFAEVPLLIARLDKLARHEDLQEKLAQVDWDLIVCDEAHKMSASYFGGELKYTRRYHLGERLSTVTRHFLLLTATPHNGKEEDFQCFMALLDPDRFEGRYREQVHASDVSDLVRRMPKEELLKFDGTPLFPERRAYTVPYQLSPAEARLYDAVTTYVREEFNRADALQNEGRRGTVGFALTILQRRLASSPEAIYQSLRRRRERLEARRREAETLSRGALPELPGLSADEIEELDDAPAEEVEGLEEELIDQATAARTVEELRAEIATLQRLETMAHEVRRSPTDRKWEELSRLLQDEEIMFDAGGARRKLVLFTEHRDTLNYLAGRIRTLLGRAEAVVIIHGGLNREERRRAQESFTQDPETMVLVATDAAGEGINLQRAHLMINYDLPWNPNRIEQRFGRIHRIGQTEVCHLWNLVARETREGDVYYTLLEKLEREREALGGRVFDVLGRAIDGAELRALLIEAIRYGDRPEVRARLTQQVEGALDRERLLGLLEEGALAQEIMDAGRVFAIRELMERMEARRLQPHFIAAFFKAALVHLGGALREREPGRYEITHVPVAIRQRERLAGVREAILPRYERICFEKEQINVPGKPLAALLAPGHPLLDATIDLVLERSLDLLVQGAVLVDDADAGEDLRALFYLEHAIQDARRDKSGQRRTVSRRMQFVEVGVGPHPFPPAPLPLSPIGERGRGMPAAGGRGVEVRAKGEGAGGEERGQGGGRGRGEADNTPHDAGPAPYLDYRPLQPEEQALVAPLVEQVLAAPGLEEQALAAPGLEEQALAFAIAHIVPRHLEEVRRVREPLVDKTLAAVKARLTQEITYWDHRAVELEEKERAGKFNARLNSARARQRADELQGRLQRRMAELQQERQLAALPPAVVGGALIVPAGLLARLRGERQSEAGLFARETKRVELAAMAAVLAAERDLGYLPRDVSGDKLGYDVESAGPAGRGKLRFLEVKGRIQGATAVTITRNEILIAFNEPEDWILALVEVPPAEGVPADVAQALKDEGSTYVTAAGCRVRYLRRPFRREPDFDATSVNYDWDRLWARGEEPR